VILLTKKYPQYKIVNFDRLDYCACIENLAEVRFLCVLPKRDNVFQ